MSTPLPKQFEQEWGYFQLSLIGASLPTSLEDLQEVARHFWQSGVRAQPDLPFSTEAVTERTGDMGEGTKLQVCREDDGDLIVSVVPQDHRFSVDGQQVQFCVPGSGGGRSPRTWEALQALWKAMALDAQERGSRQADMR